MVGDRPGSGVVSTFLAQRLGPQVAVLAVDLNPAACEATAATAAANGVGGRVDVVRSDMFGGLGRLQVCACVSFVSSKVGGWVGGTVWAR